MSVWDWLGVVVVVWLGLCALTTVSATRWLGYVARKEQQLMEENSNEWSQ